MKRLIVLMLTLSIIFIGVALSWSQQTVSEEAQRHFDRGMAAVEMAKTPADLNDTVKEFQKAIELSPNWPEPLLQSGHGAEQDGWV